MEDPFQQIKKYFDFKNKLKNEKKLINKTYQPNKCYLISREDILNWKHFYEYDKSLFSNNSLLKDWETKIKIKCQNKDKPTFKILKTFNEIKNTLNVGICIINEDFINVSKIKSNTKITKLPKYYAGNEKIVIEFEDISYNFCYICKIGKKENAKYIHFERLRFSNKSLIEDIINAKEEKFGKREFTSGGTNFNYNTCNRLDVTKKMNYKQKMLNSKNNNIINKNINENPREKKMLKIV